jgi:flagellar biosynthesis protein FlhG
VRARAPFVLVTGGKGGVGKTTLTANLGVHLASTGRAPLLVDLDLGLANLDLLLGLARTRTIEDFLAGRAELEECLALGPCGVRVLPASSGVHHLAEPDQVRRERLLEALGPLACASEIVIGDSPAGIGPDVLDFAARAQRVVVVTTPEPAALADAYGVIKALDACAAERGRDVPTPDLFVNLAADAEEAHCAGSKLAQACERFLSRTPRLLGWLPRSRAVLAAIRARAPFVLSEPHGLATRQVRQLAERLLAPRAADRARREPAPPAQGPACHVR